MNLQSQPKYCDFVAHRQNIVIYGVFVVHVGIVMPIESFQPIAFECLLISVEMAQ